MSKSDKGTAPVIVNSAKSELVDLAFRCPRFLRLSTKAGGVVREVDLSEMPVDLFTEVFPAAIRVVLMNTYNGGGKDASDAERLANLDKKLAAWKNGEANVRDRGESETAAWKEVYLSDCIAAGLTTKAAEAALKAEVHERLGKETKATFANYIEAVAIASESDDVTRDMAREALEAYYATEAAKRAAEARKAVESIKPPKIDLAAFLKPAK